MSLLIQYQVVSPRNIVHANNTECTQQGIYVSLYVYVIAVFKEEEATWILEGDTWKEWEGGENYVIIV